MGKQPHTARTTDKDYYETPPALFAQLNHVYRFTLDAAASDENHLCKRYFTEENSALENKWTGSVWCNPPFSIKELFLGYAISQRQHCNQIVFLLPGNCRETGWWNTWARQADEIVNLSPRINFLIDGKPPVNERTGRPSGAGFPCCLLVFRPRIPGAQYGEPREIYYKWNPDYQYSLLK